VIQSRPEKVYVLILWHIKNCSQGNQVKRVHINRKSESGHDGYTEEWQCGRCEQHNWHSLPLLIQNTYFIYNFLSFNKKQQCPTYKIHKILVALWVKHISVQPAGYIILFFTRWQKVIVSYFFYQHCPLWTQHQ